MCTRAVPRKKIRDKLEAERQERRRQKAIEKASCMPHYVTACSGREKLQAKIERRLKAMEEKRRNDAALVIQVAAIITLMQSTLILKSAGTSSSPSAKASTHPGQAAEAREVVVINGKHTLYP